ncbi:MAG: SprB repeat-containing protein, partial [Bacteroidota bacterium]|nr:SprB repeat-containing protein [Bacteroidota bacterium]
MKKTLLLLFGFLLVIGTTANASDRYWVGGTGSWHDAAHWSVSSGGVGGAGIPASTDDVIFDQNSFSADKQTVMLTANGTCHNITWTGIDQAAVFSASSQRKLVVKGSYTLSTLMMNGFMGETIFASSGTGNSIFTAGKVIVGDWTFSGDGSWILADDVTTVSTTFIKLIKGSLSTNDKKVSCGTFVGNSVLARSLSLGNSDIIVNNLWDLSSPGSLNFSSGTSSIIFPDSLTPGNFKSGGLIYNSVSAMAAPCSPSGTPCAAFTISLVGTNVTCNGACDGTATASVTGGSGSFTYDWSPGTPIGEGTLNVTGLCAGTYTIRVTDISSGIFCFCSIAITEPGVLFDFELVSTTPSCNDSCDATSTVAATGGTPPYSFFWSGGLGTNDTVTNVCAGTYTVDVIDSKGCFNNTVIVINEPPQLLAPGTATMVTCFGFCDGTATVNASGGTTPYTFDWTPGSPAGDGTSSITALCPNTYVLTVTDANGCTATFDTLITQPAILTLVMSQTNASCGGVCDGTATATVSGGTTPYTYTWSNGSTTTTGSTTNTVSALCDGPISVTVTDANGCTLTNSVTITEPPPLVASAAGTNVTCFGLCNGTATVTVTGGTPAYSFNWSPGSPTGDGTATISNLCPGTYTVLVTDLNGCTSTATVTITEPTILASNPTSTNVLCFGGCTGTATATPSGGTPGYSYNWLPGTPAGDGTPTITNLCIGTYSVIVTDLNGCIDTGVVVITQPPQLVAATMFTNVTCNGACDGTATANPSGGTPGYTFLWNTGATTATITGLCPGTFTLVVTDANGCTATSTVTIIQPNPIIVNISSTLLSCNGDCDATAAATVTGGTATYSFNWLPGTPSGDGTSTVINLCAGTYTLNVIDANGCAATGTEVITQPTILTLITATSDVSCFGLCDGSAAAIAGGGTPPYTFMWSPGGPGSSISGLCAGAYSVTLTDANGCTITQSVTITEPNQLLGNPSVSSTVTCAGLCNGTATSAVTGGTAPYIYNWSPGTPTGDGTPSISNLCAGNYTLTVTDSNSCTSTQAITVTQPLVLSAPITGSTSSCNICNGTATVSPSGGTPGYTILWSNGQPTPTATGLCPNTTYTVTVTDANGCTATSSVLIMQTITITITTSNTTLSCFGACDGIAIATPSGGAAPYTFLWNGPGGPYTTGTASGLCAGTYSVTVSDANGCFNTDTVTFINPPVLSVASTTTNSSCGGLCDGTATATPTGGTGAYSYSWNSSPVQTTQTATGLCAGNYTVTVTDANGCTDTSQVSITQPPLVIDNPTIIDANCTLADGSISVAPTGGTGVFAYNWGPGFPVGDGTPTITNLLPGPYTLVITSGGCTFNFNYLISNSTGPATVMSHTNVSCFGACDGTATVVASGGTAPYIYDWSPLIPVGDLTPSISALCGTVTYTVQVTDAVGCITFDTATVIAPSLISPNPTIVNESCGGTCDGSISLSPTGGTPGYTFLWSTGAITPSISGLCAGSYTVTVSDANSCDSVLVIVITSPVTLTVNVTATNVTCNSACNGTATATPAGGTGPFTYVWSTGPGSILPIIVGLCPGSYTVTVTDANNCTAIDSVTITEPLPLLTVTSQTNISCNSLCDGTAIVTASGGTLPYSYLWNPGAIANDTANGLCAGTYNATVTDGNGCVSISSSVVITQPTPIVPNATSINATCFGSCNGSAVSNPTGGTAPYTFSWNSVPVQNTQTATGLCAGTYTVTVTDALGCTNIQSVTLIDPPVLNANAATTSPVCTGDCNGTATSSPSGGTPGYTFSWSTSAITPSINSLCAGNYTVIVNDLNGCADTQTVAVSNPPAINIIVASTPANCGACDGTFTITPITGTGPYTFVWTIGGVAPASPPFLGNGTGSVTGVCAGLYSVTVTDANGCDYTFTLPMNNSGGPTGETVTENDATCNSVCNGSASLVPIGGVPPYTYLWNDLTGTTNDTALNLCAGNYFVQVTDANGCIHFSPVTIGEPTPIISNGVVTSAVCSNVCTGAITVAPSGGTPGYTYFWTPGVITGQGTPSVSGLCPGTFTLTITDLNGCTMVDSFFVGQTTPLAATVTSMNITCSSVCSGSAFVSISTGTPPYIIQWNDPSGQTNDTATALCAGTYTVDITDSLGCSITLTTTITSTPAVSANAVITGATCGACDGAATLAPTGGTPAYTY